MIQPFLDNFLPDFCWLFIFGFCVYLCSHLPCFLDGWILILVFIFRVFLLFEYRKLVLKLQFATHALGWDLGCQLASNHKGSLARFLLYMAVSFVASFLLFKQFSQEVCLLIKAKSFVESSPTHATSLVDRSDPCYITKKMMDAVFLALLTKARILCLDSLQSIVA